MKISFTEVSAPIGASVSKFCVHFQIGKVYCVKKIKMLILILPSFLNFSFIFSVTLNKYIWTFFLSKISQQLLDLGF